MNQKETAPVKQTVPPIKQDNTKVAPVKQTVPPIKQDNTKVAPVKQETNKALVVNSELNSEMFADALQNNGFENITAEDMAIPFVSILQALSPHIRGATKIKGAEEGYFFNNVTLKCMQGPIMIVPCAYIKSYIEWVPREDGGGFVKQHMDSAILNQTVKNDKNQDILPNGNIVVTTASHYCVLLNKDGSYERVVLSFTSTQLKKSRRWNSIMLNLQVTINGKKITPPMYSHYYAIDSEDEANDFGSWKGYKLGDATMLTDAECYAFCKKFHNDVSKGIVKINPLPPDDFQTTVTVHPEETNVF